MKKRKKKEQALKKASCWSIQFVDRETFDMVTGIATGRIELDPSDKDALNSAWHSLLTVTDELERSGYQIKTLVLRNALRFAAENADSHAGMSEKAIVVEMLVELYRTVCEFCRKEEISIFDDRDGGLFIWSELEREVRKWN